VNLDSGVPSSVLDMNTAVRLLLVRRRNIRKLYFIIRSLVSYENSELSNHSAEGT